MSHVEYPLFLRDLDNVFCFVESEEHLSVLLEPNDVEEYSGWDRTGRPVSLRLSQEQIKVVIEKETDETPQLMTSIRSYAETFSNVVVNPPTEDPVELLKWAETEVETYRRSGTFATRVVKYLRRVFGFDKHIES